MKGLVERKLLIVVDNVREECVFSIKSCYIIDRNIELFSHFRAFHPLVLAKGIFRFIVKPKLLCNDILP